MKNQFILVGNVGQKPELKTTKNGKSYINFSLAVNERYKPKDSNEYQDKTSWFNLTLWDKKAESLSKLLEKGSKISVSGKLQTRTQEIDGKKYTFPDLVVLQVDLLSNSSKKDNTPEDDSADEIQFNED